jgi:hypothetical protein
MVGTLKVPALRGWFNPPMGDWWFAIGPVIAVLLAFKLQPWVLMTLAALTAVAFFISFGVSFDLYDECDPCSRRAETLFALNGILFSLAPSLFVVSIGKLVVSGRS